MLKKTDFDVIVAFVADNEHVYGHAAVYNPETGAIMGSTPINSAGEATANYFLSDGKINGYNLNQISRLELHKGECYLILINKHHVPA